VRLKDCRVIYRGMQPACRLFLVLAVLGSCKGLPADGSRGNREQTVASLRSALARDGLGAALESLQAAAGRDSTILRDAHQLAHDLGRLAIAEAGNASVIRQCSPVFSSGCYHGVVESYVQSRHRVDMVGLERTCTAAGDADNPGPIAECIHGLGHGVLGALSLDLDRTLHHCDALSTPDRRGGCYSGAFMEAVMTALREHAPAPSGHAHEHTAQEHGSQASGRLAIDSSAPFSPCAEFDDPYAKACWVYQGFLILRQVGFDAGAALEHCRQAPAARVAQCAQSIGFQITGLSQRGNDWIVEQCGGGPGEQSIECGAGASAALTSIDWSGARAARFCRAAPASWRSRCYASAVRVLSSLASPADVRQFCKTLVSDGIAACAPHQRPVKAATQ
jgi:hypothetical protein